jgi:hypothetical protein
MEDPRLSNSIFSSETLDHALAKVEKRIALRFDIQWQTIQPV